MNSKSKVMKGMKKKDESKMHMSKVKSAAKKAFGGKY